MKLAKRTLADAAAGPEEGMFGQTPDVETKVAITFLDEVKAIPSGVGDAERDELSSSDDKYARSEVAFLSGDGVVDVANPMSPLSSSLGFDGELLMSSPPWIRFGVTEFEDEVGPPVLTNLLLLEEVEATERVRVRIRAREADLATGTVQPWIRIEEKILNGKTSI